MAASDKVGHYKEFGELIQPFKDPERVSQLVRKLLKTTGLDCEGMDELIIKDIETKFDNIGDNKDECECLDFYIILSPLAEGLRGKEIDNVGEVSTIWNSYSLNQHG
ncbi:hypothetical protein Tco_0933069 [Tanacetum coccineum]